ncbi:MAG: right-handed parallel beta-helix repeat-containing protein [Armatimonadetes bacterium]|nr:right-handed parallel beta-helix repeat-containing protein [Armatimonadota bacterium]
MSARRMLLGCLALMVSQAVLWAQDGLLLHYTFDEPAGRVIADRSPNKLDGTTSGTLVASPSGQALSCDGTGASVVSVKLPDNQRFGKGSWSVSLWLKPTRFDIADAQNQRRIFGCGTYPDAYLVLDLMANGTPNYYFCYKGADGKVASTGGGGAMGLKVGEWAHLVLSVDRAKGRVDVFLNGFNQGGSTLPAGWSGDFSVGGELTLGNGWHNYMGLMDEAKVYRRALTRADAKAEFDRLQKTFGVIISPEAAAAERREALMQDFAKSHDDWARGDYTAVRRACVALIATKELPAPLRSYAHLRSAQTWVAQGKAKEAQNVYNDIANNVEYPQVHRDEALACAREIEREGKGLPGHNPLSSRHTPDAVTKFEAEIIVSPTGDDAANGVAKPVASLTRARDLVRAQRARGVKGAVTVTLLPGEYRVTGPLALTAPDSGTDSGPTVYRASQPGKTRLYGGQRLTGFGPVTDAAITARLPEASRGKVMRCDLKEQGITEYGQLAVRGFGQPDSPPTLEVFVNGRALTPARWPNEGFVGIGKLTERGDRGQKKPSVFEYLDDRHARWTQADDAWLFGYFRYLWADATIKVSKIDPATKTMTCNEAYQYGGPGMDPGQGIQYYAFNLLEEIDQPGEYYLDRKSGVLYLYPPTDLAGATVEVGLLATPMVTADSVNDLRFEGLTFDLGRSNGLVLTNCNRALVAGCTVSRLAGNGITINGGTADGIYGCDIHTIGRRATEVIGGDRATLTPGQHFVENCQIHNFGRIDRTYTPAIQLEGVGNRVAHNLMYDCPSSVMRIEGNDHLIEYNDVHSAVRESDDQGAMELFGNPTYRGVIFRYNRFENCGKDKPGAAVHGQAAIRFDDAISGMVVYGNVFIRSANGNFGAVQINSGRDNIMDNNLFVDCKQGVSGGWHAGNSCWVQMAQATPPAAYINNPLYQERYPEMKTMLKPPGINYLWRNVFYRSGDMVRGNRAGYDLIENGEWPEANPGFVNPEAGDYDLKAKSELLAKVGFKPIPIDEIGLYDDDFRASWPVVTKPVSIPDWRKAAGH